MTVETVNGQGATDAVALRQPAADLPPLDTTAPAGSEAGAPVPDTSAEPPARRRGRPKGSTARRTRTVELTLTVSGTADGDWQAELRHGDVWVARDLPVAAAAVSRAAKELHDDLAGPIDEVIHAAVSQQKARVAALEAELEQARKALAELSE
jgi:hypothetical protein